MIRLHVPACSSLAPLLVALLWTGCGGEDAPQGAPEAPSETGSPARSSRAAPASVDACSLVSRARVEAAVGEPVSPGRLEEHGTGPGESYFSTCTFAAESEESFTSVTVTARPAADIADPSAALEAHVADMRASAMPDYRLEPVESLEAVAGWDPAMGQLTAFRRGFALIVGVSGSVADPRGAAVELARAALAAQP